MNITYSYKVLSVDAQARCMEVLYTSDGRQTMHIGARLPYEGEQLEEVIKAFAPIRLWEEAEMPVAPPEVGHSGTVEIVEQEIAPLPQPVQTGVINL